MTIPRQPSPEQQSILDHVKNKQDHLLIEAVAGAGKTTTLRQIYQSLSDEQRESCRFLAFNEAIARELEDTGLPAKTFHAECLDVIKASSSDPDGVIVDGQKTLKLIMSILPDQGGEYRKKVNLIVGRAKTYGVKPDSQFLDQTTWPEFALDGLHCDKNHLSDAKKVLEKSIDQPSIDYDDMLYLPFLNDLKFNQYSMILVDEVQDFNLLQHYLLRKMLKQGGRIIAVGDAQQAIYAFRGALPDSIEKFKKTFKPTCLPLSVTWRCPAGHVEKIRADLSAFNRFQNINASSDNKIPDSPRFESTPEPKPGDLIISHSNVNVISIFKKLLEAGLSAVPTGYHAEEHLNRFLSSEFGKDHSLTSFKGWVDREMVLRRSIDPSDKGFDLIALQAMVEVNGKVDTESLFKMLRAADKNVIRVSTIHRAKGLEADNVWLVGQDLLQRGALNDNDPQKANLYYVAMTRAKKKLRFVRPSAFNNNISADIDVLNVTDRILVVKGNPWSKQYQNTWISDNGLQDTGICTGIETYESIVEQCKIAREKNLYVYVTERSGKNYCFRSFGKVGDITPTGRLNNYKQALYYVEFIEVRGISDHQTQIPGDSKSCWWYDPKG